jgi:hypothetical protein
LLLAGVLLLGGCNEVLGPSFEERLTGTWQCTPVKTTPGKSMTYTLTYTPDGKITGEMVFTEKAGDATAALRGNLDGTWTYDGKVLGHKMTESFKDLTVNGKLVPREEVNPALIAGFRTEDSYNDPVDLVKEELVWYSDPERKQVDARCTKGKAKPTDDAKPKDK